MSNNRRLIVFLFLITLSLLIIGYFLVKYCREYNSTLESSDTESIFTTEDNTENPTEPEDSLSAIYRIFNDCPPIGDAISEEAILLNKLKNRFRIPDESDFDTSITLARILEEGDDNMRWSVHKAARITGYVYEVKAGGIETCNCREKDRDGKDTHIELVLNPMHDQKTQRMVVEVTPRMRDIMSKQGIDWTTSTLRSEILGRWVQVEGWLMLDTEHLNAAENTNPGRERNWRATAWEIHPITKIEVVDRPFNTQ